MKVTRTPLIGLTMLLIVLSVYVPTAFTQAGSDNLIVYMAEIDNNRDIYVAPADGSGEPERLTTDTNEDNMPAWSPDRSQIAFVSNREGLFEIFVMNADGSNQRNVSANNNYNEAPAWSPDGRKIAFISDGTRSPDVYLMNADGSEQVNLTFDENDDFEPTFSPDGRSVAFISWRSEGVGIFAVNTDSSNPRPLIPPSQDAEYASPSWSPDGQMLAYVATIYDAQGSYSELYVANADGSDPDMKVQVESAYIKSVNWSPDGKELVYEESPERGRESQIRVLGLADQSIRSIAGGAEPSWFTPLVTAAIDYGIATGIQDIECPGTLPSRLIEGQRGRVVPVGERNNVRDNPSTSARLIGKLDLSARFDVLEGPRCEDGFAWYRVAGRGNARGIEGWTAEADNRDYWLEPLQNAAPTGSAITAPPAGTQLLTGGIGQTTRARMGPGEFQVEYYCSQQGYSTRRDQVNWYCVGRNGSRTQTLGQAEFDQICRDTYNNSSAVAVRDGNNRTVAFNWRCYGTPGASGSNTTTTTSSNSSGGGGGSSGFSDCNTDFAEGDTVQVDFNRGSALRIMVDYRTTTVQTVAQAYDNDILTLLEGPECPGRTTYWYVALHFGSERIEGWAAEADDSGNPFMCSQSQPECRR